jgi:hypothetical protein
MARNEFSAEVHAAVRVRDGLIVTEQFGGVWECISSHVTQLSFGIMELSQWRQPGMMGRSYVTVTNGVVSQSEIIS